MWILLLSKTLASHHIFSVERRVDSTIQRFSKSLWVATLSSNLRSHHSCLHEARPTQFLHSMIKHFFCQRSDCAPVRGTFPPKHLSLCLVPTLSHGDKFGLSFRPAVACSHGVSARPLPGRENIMLRVIHHLCDVHNTYQAERAGRAFLFRLPSDNRTASGNRCSTGRGYRRELDFVRTALGFLFCFGFPRFSSHFGKCL